MRHLQLSIVVTLVVLLNGCVLGTRHIDLSPPDVADTNKASGNIYIGEITDNRKFEAAPRNPSTPSVYGDLAATSKATLATLIGRRRNAYGGAMGDPLGSA